MGSPTLKGNIQSVPGRHLQKISGTSLQDFHNFLVTLFFISLPVIHESWPKSILSQAKNEKKHVPWLRVLKDKFCYLPLRSLWYLGFFLLKIRVKGSELEITLARQTILQEKLTSSHSLSWQSWTLPGYAMHKGLGRWKRQPEEQCDSRLQQHNTASECQHFYHIINLAIAIISNIFHL